MENKELQKYYESLFDTFTTSGWDVFIEDIQAGAEATTLDRCSDEKEFWKAKGKLEVYRQVLTYKDFIENGYEEAQRAQDS